MEDRQIVELFLQREEAAIDRTREKYGPAPGAGPGGHGGLPDRRGVRK